MTAQSYRFQLGNFECVSLYDGTFNYPPELFFATVVLQELEGILQQQGLPVERIATPYTCLFINTGRHRVMIDTGAGRLAAHAEKMFPGIDHSTTRTGQLVQSLRTAGIEPGTIDTVIITHAHPDHVGGTLDEHGNLVFANAHYFLSKDEWAFWTSGMAMAQAAPAMVAIARKNLEPLQDRLTLVEDGFEVVPGLQIVAAPGHTPGHVVVSVTSAGERLLNIADLVLHPLHLQHPEWFPVFDISVGEASASKYRICAEAAETQALVFAHHFAPFPNLGYIRKSEEGWQWEPLRETGNLRTSSDV